MITREKYGLIVKEVEEAIHELILKCVGSEEPNGNMSLQFNNYFLFINNCFLIEDEIKFNFEEEIVDSDRSNFYIDFLEEHYTFEKSDFVDDNTYRFFLELMIFTHFWESKYMVNKLAQLANLSIIEKYDLEIYKKHPYYKYNSSSPSLDNSGIKIHEYIRNNIKKKFIKSNLKIGKIFSKAYNSQIRNAFAHSDFYFLKSERKIIFKNNTEKHTVPFITFDEWTERFCYTFLISYLLEKRVKIDYDNFTKETKNIQIYIENDTYLVVLNKSENRFNFSKKP